MVVPSNIPPDVTVTRLELATPRFSTGRSSPDEDGVAILMACVKARIPIECLSEPLSGQKLCRSG